LPPSPASIIARLLNADAKSSAWTFTASGRSRNLVFDLSITHDRFGSSSHVQQNGSLSHPQDLDGQIRVAAQRKTNAYRQTYADNQNISFLPAINEHIQPHARRVFASSFSTGPPGDLSALHCRWNAIATQSIGIISVQTRCILPRPDSESKVGLAAAKTAVLRINLNVQGCTQSPSPPCSLVRDGQTSPHRPRLVVSRSTCPPISPPPHTALY
jgi:hypothetical protein